MKVVMDQAGIEHTRPESAEVIATNCARRRGLGAVYTRIIRLYLYNISIIESH